LIAIKILKILIAREVPGAGEILEKDYIQSFNKNIVVHLVKL
tara:strand:+ start:4557 stop:4682 length:126 start_codon:yes stop_codon:yes gene_type:complete